MKLTKEQIFDFRALRWLWGISSFPLVSIVPPSFTRIIEKKEVNYFLE